MLGWVMIRGFRVDNILVITPLFAHTDHEDQRATDHVPEAETHRRSSTNLNPKVLYNGRAVVGLNSNQTAGRL